MKLLSLDTETTIVDLGRGRKCRDSFNVPDLVCLSWWNDGENGDVDSWDDPGLGEWLAEELRRRVIVGHNIPFDILVLCKAFPTLEPLWRRAVADGRVLDTMVLAHLREPCVKQKSLAALAKFHLGLDLGGKGDIQVSFTRDRPLTAEQREYALQDAKVTLALAERLRALPLGSVYRGRAMKRHQMECPENHNLPPGRAGFHPLDHVYSSCFISTRCWSEPLGWNLDLEKMEKHRAAGREKIETHARELHKHGLIRRVRDTSLPAVPSALGGASSRVWTYDTAADRFTRTHKGVLQEQPARWQLDERAVRHELHLAADDLKLSDVPTSTKTNAISMTYDYWKLYRDELSPGLRAFLDYARAQKYESLFFKTWATSRTGRAHPTFYIPGTETLRHASSRPNLHQIAKPLREIFHVKDHVIVGADYSALECYTLCHTLCNLGLRGPLFDTLDAGGDLHSLTAARMLGGSPDQFGKGTTERQAAKALNFGIPGGLGIKKMYAYGRQSYGLDWTPEEAGKLYRAWLDAYTDVAEYLQWFKSQKPWHLKPRGQDRDEWLRELGFDEWPGGWDLTMALDKGRLYDVQLSSGARLPARNYTQGTNCAFQHLGAVATSHAINKCFAAGLPVIAAVHDAIYLAAPDRSSLYPTLLENIMSDALHETCPLAPRQRVEAEIKETFF